LVTCGVRLQSEGQPYVIRLKMPANYKIPAHYHPVAEAVTVISGEFSVGMGDKHAERDGTASG
jgi:anti-sigma factor ChrR (cupin superfamily)